MVSAVLFLRPDREGGAARPHRVPTDDTALRQRSTVLALRQSVRPEDLRLLGLELGLGQNAAVA